MWKGNWLQEMGVGEIGNHCGVWSDRREMMGLLWSMEWLLGQENGVYHGV